MHLQSKASEQPGPVSPVAGKVEHLSLLHSDNHQISMQCCQVDDDLSREAVYVVQALVRFPCYSKDAGLAS